MAREGTRRFTSQASAILILLRIRREPAGFTLGYTVARDRAHSIYGVSDLAAVSRYLKLVDLTLRGLPRTSATRGSDGRVTSAVDRAWLAYEWYMYSAGFLALCMLLPIALHLFLEMLAVSSTD